MRWSDIITLIGLKMPEDGKTTNENGFALEPKEQSRFAFCNKKSAWQSEFYKAQQIGIKVEFNIELHKIDYEGEELVEYEGKRYKVLRVDEQKNGELIDLVLSDLSERGEPDGEI